MVKKRKTGQRVWYIHTGQCAFVVDYKEDRLGNYLFGKRIMELFVWIGRNKVLSFLSAITFLFGLVAACAGLLPQYRGFGKYSLIGLPAPIISVLPFFNTKLCGKVLSSFNSLYLIANCLICIACLFAEFWYEPEALLCLPVLSLTLTLALFVDTVPPTLRKIMKTRVFPIVLSMSAHIVVGTLFDLFRLREVRLGDKEFGMSVHGRLLGSSLTILLFFLRLEVNIITSKASLLTTIATPLQCKPVAVAATKIFQALDLKSLGPVAASQARSQGPHRIRAGKNAVTPLSPTNKKEATEHKQCNGNDRIEEEVEEEEEDEDDEEDYEDEGLGTVRSGMELFGEGEECSSRQRFVVFSKTVPFLIHPATDSLGYRCLGQRYSVLAFAALRSKSIGPLLQLLSLIGNVGTFASLMGPEYDWLALFAAMSIPVSVFCYWNFFSLTLIRRLLGSFEAMYVLFQAVGLLICLPFLFPRHAYLPLIIALWAINLGSASMVDAVPKRLMANSFSKAVILIGVGVVQLAVGVYFGWIPTEDTYFGFGERKFSVRMQFLSFSTVLSLYIAKYIVENWMRGKTSLLILKSMMQVHPLSNVSANEAALAGLGAERALQIVTTVHSNVNSSFELG